MSTDSGDITINRPDGRIARMTRPGFPPREAALHRRTADGIIAEELRRLDPDEIYGETLEELPHLDGWPVHTGHRPRSSRISSSDGIDVGEEQGGAAPAGPAARTGRLSTSAAATKPAAKKPAARKPAAANQAAAKKPAAKKPAAKKPAARPTAPTGKPAATQVTSGTATSRRASGTARGRA